MIFDVFTQIHTFFIHEISCFFFRQNIEVGFKAILQQLKSLNKYFTESKMCYFFYRFKICPSFQWKSLLRTFSFKIQKQ